MNADAQALIAKAVSRAFCQALNASLEAVACEAPSSTLTEVKSAFLEAWRREARSREDYWVGQLDLPPRKVLS